MNHSNLSDTYLQNVQKRKEFRGQNILMKSLRVVAVKAFSSAPLAGT